MGSKQDELKPPQQSMLIALIIALHLGQAKTAAGCSRYVNPAMMKVNCCSITWNLPTRMPASILVKFSMSYQLAKAYQTSSTFSCFAQSLVLEIASKGNRRHERPLPAAATLQKRTKALDGSLLSCRMPGVVLLDTYI